MENDRQRVDLGAAILSGTAKHGKVGCGLQRNGHAGMLLAMPRMLFL
jgi:hypothetical protein